VALQPLVSETKDCSPQTAFLGLLPALPNDKFSALAALTRITELLHAVLCHYPPPLAPSKAAARLLWHRSATVAAPLSEGASAWFCACHNKYADVWQHCRLQ